MSQTKKTPLLAILVVAAVVIGGIWLYSSRHQSVASSTKSTTPAATSSTAAPATTPTSQAQAAPAASTPVASPAPSAVSTPAPATEKPKCDPNYTGCVPNVYPDDVDCAGGRGNGPYYVTGPVRVTGTDLYDLDREGDKVACE